MKGRVLVQLTWAGGVAGVIRDQRGAAWLVDDLERGGGTGLEDHRAGVCGLASELTLAGGLLPPGAVRAVVRDRTGRSHEAVCGEGAWAVVLPEPVRGIEPVVRFSSPTGELVPVPLPAGVRLEPVQDAREPCPVCGAADWGRVVEAPPWRYGSDGAGRPTAAVCRRCGREESLGVLFAASTGEPPDEEAVAAARAEAAQRLAAAARSAPFEPFGVRGERPEPGGYGSHGDRIDSITLAFETAGGPLWVETSVEEPFEPPEWVARDALEGLLHEREGSWPSGSETAVSLWLCGREREHAAAAAAAPRAEVDVPVDGAPTRFVLVRHGERFAAVAEASGRVITLTGHGDPAGLALETMPLE